MNVEYVDKVANMTSFIGQFVHPIGGEGMG